jgi:excisionase family DNA binding protein
VIVNEFRDIQRRAQRRLHPVEEAAHILGVGRTVVYEKIGSRELESVKIGARRLIPSDALDAYIARLRAEHTSDAG